MDINKGEKIKDRDVELVSKAIKNADDFAKIVQRYELPIGRYIRRLGCREDSDVQDLLQEIFIKVYINLNEYDKNLKFSSWIYRIAHNETISFFRKRNIRPSPIQNREELNLIENIADKTDFTKSLNDKFNADMLGEALLEIEEKYRNVIILHFLEEKDYHEISDILKVPMGTVGTLISRGKKRLNSILTKKNLHHGQ